MRALEDQLAMFGDLLEDLEGPITPSEVSGLTVETVRLSSRRPGLRLAAAAAVVVLILFGLVPFLLNSPTSSPADDPTLVPPTTVPATPSTTVPVLSEVPSVWLAYSVYLPHTETNDVRIVEPNGVARSLVGTAEDGIWRMCPQFSSTGDHLAWVETLGKGSNSAPSQDWVLVVAEFDRSTGEHSDEIRVPVRSGSACGAWSPDGGRYAYPSPEGQLALLETGKALPTQTGHRVGRRIAWSPDGTNLASILNDGVLITPLDGGEERVIVPRAESRYSWLWGVSWSPDGQRLLVNGITYDEPFETEKAPDDHEFMWIVNIQGELLDEWNIDREGRIGPGVAGETLVMAPSWSPDGEKIAYATSMMERPADGSYGPLDPFDHQITVRTLATGNEIAIDPGDALEKAGLEWTSDGEWLLVLTRHTLRAFAPESPDKFHVLVENLAGPRAEARMEAQPGMSTVPALHN